MAEYGSWDDMVENNNNPLFLGYLSDKFGIDDPKKVSMLDRDALLYAFKYRMRELGYYTDEDTGMINSLAKKWGDKREEIEEYAHSRFGDAPDKLGDDERAILCLFAYDAYKKQQEEELKREAEEINNNDENNSDNHDNPDNSDNEDNKENSDDRNNPDNRDSHDNHDDLGNNDNSGGNDNSDNREYQNTSGWARIRSKYSDSNEQWIRWYKLAIMKDILEKDFPEDLPEMLNPAETIDLMNKYEPKLSEAQLDELAEKLTDKIIDDEQLFDNTPPSILASMYDSLKGRTQDVKDDEERVKIARQLSKVTHRIDELAEMAAKDKDLYFGDVTNIYDTYRGYNEMFAARYNDLLDSASNGETEEEKRKASDTLENFQKMQETAEKTMADYDNVNNLTGISAENAENLDKRFEYIRKTMKGVEISPETAKMVANFKFLSSEYSSLSQRQVEALKERFPDKDFSTTSVYRELSAEEKDFLYSKNLMPSAEAQFIDKDGNQTDKWSEGAKIIPGSKLDKAILAAKQNVMLSNLGAGTEITPEFLQQELDSELPKTLYTLHVVDMVNQGVMEDPEQFDFIKHPEYLEYFKRDLQNVERPMAIGPTSFEAGIDTVVNQTGGYAERLADLLSRDKDGKPVNNPNINVATKLFEPIASIDKNAKDRVIMKANGNQSYWKTVGKTFISAGTMSCAMRLVGTAAQSVTGLQYATPMLGSLLAVGLTYYQWKQWKKQREAAGLDSGWKSAFKDRRMLMTTATTALGCAATACMAFPGAQPIGAILGVSAMVVGATNGIWTAIKAARANGEPWWKGGLKALGILGAAGVGALSGGLLANATMDFVNNQFPENRIFQHEETFTSTTKDEHYEVDRGKLEADANRYNEQYNISDRVHPGMDHNEYMDAVAEYNKTHPDNPITNPDELLKAAFNSQNGRIYGPGYVATHGLDPNVVKSVGNLINSDGTINPDAVSAWNSSDLWKASGLENFVHKVNEPVETRPDLYPTRDPSSTFSGTRMPLMKIITTHFHNTTEVVANTRPSIGSVFGVDLGAPAMVGVLGGGVTQQKMLKKRSGSLLDKIKQMFSTKQKTVIEDKKPLDVVNQGDNKEPIVNEDTTKKKYVAPRVKAMPVADVMITMEYRCIYGCKPNKRELQTYKVLVNKEFNKAREEGSTKAENLSLFLQERADKFEIKIKQKLEQDGKEDTTKNRGFALRDARREMNRSFSESVNTGDGRVLPTLQGLIDHIRPQANNKAPSRKKQSSRVE